MTGTVIGGWASVLPRIATPTPSRTYSAAFPGTPDQVAQARSFMRHILHGCPVADDAVLLCSGSYAPTRSCTATPAHQAGCSACTSKHMRASEYGQGSRTRAASGRNAPATPRGCTAWTLSARWRAATPGGSSRRPAGGSCGTGSAGLARPTLPSRCTQLHDLRCRVAGWRAQAARQRSTTHGGGPDRAATGNAGLSPPPPCATQRQT